MRQEIIITVMGPVKKMMFPHVIAVPVCITIHFLCCVFFTVDRLTVNHGFEKFLFHLNTLWFEMNFCGQAIISIMVSLLDKQESCWYAILPKIQPVNLAGRSAWGRQFQLTNVSVGLRRAWREAIELKKRARREGTLQSFRFNSGMQLHIADFKPSETIVERFGSGDTVFRFFFHLLASGHWELKSPYRSISRSRLMRANGFSSVIYYPEMEGKMFLPVNRRQFHLSIYLRPSMLNSYFGGCLDQLPKTLIDISRGCVETGFAHESPLSPMMHRSIRQLLDCPYTGPMKQLYMENKAIELIVYKLAQTITSEAKQDAPPKLVLQETERIHRAGEILCRNLESPPGLFDLAHAVGTNHGWLNRGFRELYGTTVFGYLRQRRLIEARRLIEVENASVTEAALSVGYNSISSFSKAFCAYFGMRPAACRKKRTINA